MPLSYFRPVTTSWPLSNGGIRLRRRTSTGIDRQLVGEAIDDALEHERRFRTSGAAIRLDRRRVRVDAVDVFLHRADLVRTRQHQSVKNRRNAGRGGRQIRAHAGPHGAAQAEDASVLRRRHLDVLHMIAAVRRRLVVLRAGLDPLHRTPELHRAEHRDEVALDLRNLAAEAAADFRRDHAKAIFGNAADERHDEADDVRVLRRVPERQLAGRRDVVRERAARLHRRRDQPLLNDAIADDDVGFA